MTLKKPSVFRLLDAATFGLAALLAVLAFVWAYLTPGNSTIALVITSVTALGFVGLYALVLFWRWDFIRRITYVTKHGMLVMCNGFKVTQEAVETEVDRVLKLWIKATSYGRFREELDGLILYWKPFPFVHYSNPRFKFTGLASNTSRAIAVGYRPLLKDTALGHELGHVFLRAYRGDETEKGLKTFTGNHGLPY